MRTIDTKTYASRFSFLILPIFLLLALSACAGPYGHLRSDAQVTHMFESNTVPGDYNYYYDGRANMPYAIIGLKPEYTLTSRLWEPFSPNTTAFNYAVRFVYERPVGEASYPPYGSLILDDKGKTVGIWYSRYRSTGIMVGPDKKVTVHSPYNEEGSIFWDY